MGWFNSEFLHFIFNDVRIFESRVPILLVNALFKCLAKRLAQRVEAKRWMVWLTIWSRCVTKPISTWVCFIQRRVHFCIEVGHEESHSIYWQISELYNCWNPRSHCFNIMADVVFRCDWPHNGGSFFLCLLRGECDGELLLEKTIVLTCVAWL